MNWQQIMEQVLEISELQQEILIKSNNPVIKEITTRNEKYCSDPNFDLKSLNNAILEHKIEITPYQIIIIEKINKLSLNTDSQSIYINMPESEEEAEKYVIELKKKYELVNNSFELIMNIEKLAETEYTSNSNFENTEYAKKVNVENQLFKKIKDDFLGLTPEIYENILINNQKEYMSKLNTNSKMNLFIETLTLSYDKNAFDYFNKEMLIMEIGKLEKYNLQQISALGRLYNKYKTSLMIAEKIILSKMTLEEIYDEFKIIYETKILKPKISKK